MSPRLVIITLSLALIVGCAGRMTADEFNRQFGLPKASASAPVAREDQDDTDQARRFAARRYLQVFGIDRLVDNMVHEVAKEVPQAKRPELFQQIQRMFPRDEIEETMMRIFVKHFTRRQLNAAADFYSTPEGRSIVARGWRITGPPVPSDGPVDTPRDRLVAAQRYLFEIDGKRLYGEMMRVVASRYSSLEESETFLWEANRGYTDFERQFLDTMVAYSTRAEIEALMRFHRSDDGRPIMIRFPSVMDEFVGYVIGVIRREGPTLQKSLN